MNEHLPLSDLFARLRFTNQEIAEYCGISESFVRKILNNTKNPSPMVAERLVEFVERKIAGVENLVSSYKTTV